MQNRNAAATSRNRKKSALRALEDEVADLKRTAAELTERLRSAEQENARLKAARRCDDGLSMSAWSERGVKRARIDGGIDRAGADRSSESSHELADHESHSATVGSDDTTDLQSARVAEPAAADIGGDVLTEFAILTSPQWKTSPTTSPLNGAVQAMAALIYSATSVSTSYSTSEYTTLRQRPICT